VRDTQALKWHVEQETAAAVVRVAGEVDLATEEDFTEALDEVLAGDSEVVLVDLSGVTFLGSVGLHLLLQANRKATQQQRTLKVAHGGSFVERVLTVAGFDQVVEIVETF
jgi:anti-sigma B factor antagonist